MIPVQLEVLPNQEGKIRKAFQKGKSCSIHTKKVRAGPHSLVLRNPYAKRYQEAPMGQSVKLPFRHEDLIRNLHHKGGFLPLLFAALAPIIGGVAGGLIEKEIAGSGLARFSKNLLRHGGGGVKKSKKKSTTNKSKLFTLEKRGSGLYLNPWKS